MTVEQSIMIVREKSAEIAADCDRLAARGSMQKWEAVSLRSKADAVSSAAMELELRLTAIAAKEHPEEG